jgi:hypothetical protein
MRLIERKTRSAAAAVLLAAGLLSASLFAQAPPPPPPGYPAQPGAYPPAGPPPNYPPATLDQLVQRIALYPDPLLSQVLAAATFPDQIPDAARWADQHHYLTGPALADAIQADHLPWDPSVQALLPFPNVLEMMAGDPNWTRQLGDAFLANQQSVMDAVQRERQSAYNYGYLRTNAYETVSPGPYITIMPVNPALLYVPYYDPLIVFGPPRPGFVVGGAIRFGFGISLGVAFRPWGWGVNYIDWGRRAVIVNNAPWRRGWVNRYSYVHPYTLPRYEAARRIEGHDLHERTQREREVWRGGGRERVEEHRR